MGTAAAVGTRRARIGAELACLCVCVCVCSVSVSVPVSVSVSVSVGVGVCMSVSVRAVHGVCARRCFRVRCRDGAFVLTAYVLQCVCAKACTSPHITLYSCVFCNGVTVHGYLVHRGVLCG